MLQNRLHFESFLVIPFQLEYLPWIIHRFLKSVDQFLHEDLFLVLLILQKLILKFQVQSLVRQIMTFYQLKIKLALLSPFQFQLLLLEFFLKSFLQLHKTLGEYLFHLMDFSHPQFLKILLLVRKLLVLSEELFSIENDS